MAKTKTKFKVAKPLGCAALAAVCALSTIYVTSYKAFADSKAYEGYTFDLETKSRQDSLDKANKFNETIAEEGFVLLQNKNKALPIATSASTKKKINLFGKNWSNPAFGGGGSSSFSTSSGDGIDGYTSIKNANFEFNPTLKAFYDDEKASGAKRPQYQYQAADMITAETPQSMYTKEVKDSLANYSDASIVMVSRTGGEGIDVSDFFFGKSVAGRSGDLAGQHYLQLDDNEKALIDLARTTVCNDKPVVLVLNSAQPLEFTDEILEKVDAVLWIGLPGSTGFAALGRILNGEVNPSGRTVDMYVKDFNRIPAVQNFGTNKKAVEYNNPDHQTPSFTGVKSPAGNTLSDASGKTVGAEVIYEEGIYVGYKYYETRAYEEDNKSGAIKNKWYEDNVRYPFGYGLSYTTFKYSNIQYKMPNLITKDSEVTVSLTVTNTGDVAGKEVVQLYYSAPYTVDKIEKAHVNLGDFAKTGLLKPQASETVTMKISLESMASYDWNDANGNGFKGYELDAGAYNFYVSSDSHSWYDADTTAKETLTLADGYKYEMDIDGKTDGNDNQFDDVSAGIEGRGIDEMSRADFEGTFPAKPTAEEKKVSSAFAGLLKYGVTSDADPDGSEYDKDQPWYVADDKKPTQRAKELTEEDENVIRLMSLKDVEPYDENGNESAQWKAFLDQFTVQQLMDFVENGKFRSQKFDVLGIPEGIHPDGPFGFVGQINGYGSARCYYVSPCIVAATFNKKLVEQQGEHMGEEGAWMGYNGIYGPGVNIHRTPFSGRNFEYYSEDGYLSGIMAAYLTKGMQSKGVFPFLKHFALNDQETDRNGVTTWATEQTMREIYLKAFQLAIDVNSTDLFDDANYVGHRGALGVMSSFNRVGTTWAGASYPLLTNVLRNEWGFKGIVVTDWYNGGYMDQEQMVRAGNDLSLGNDVGTQGSKNITANYKKYGDQMLTATLLTALRKAALNLSYTTLHSCNMSKLVNYEDTINLNDSYVACEGEALEIDFASAVYAAEFTGCTYEVVPSDKKTSHATKPVALPEDLPAKYATVNGSKVTVNISDFKAGTYQLTVAIKNVDGKYIGQSATVNIVYTAKSMEATLGDLINEVDSLKTSLGTLNTQIADLTARLANAATKEEVAALETAIEALEAESAATKAALEAKVAALEATVESLTAKDAELQQKLDELQQKLDELNGKVDEKGGCGSSVGVLGTSIIMAVSAMLMAAVVVTVRKSKKSDK